MGDKSKFVGKEKAILKFEGTTLELPIAVSKICVVCPYWEDDGLDFQYGGVRPNCGQHKCNANKIYGATVKERKELKEKTSDLFGDILGFGGSK